VAIAAKAHLAGTTGARVLADNMVRFERMPRPLCPRTPSPRLTGRTKQVITSNIPVGQLLLAANFGEQSSVTGDLALPGARWRLRCEPVPGQVAGYVRAGSQVAIFLTYGVVDKNGAKTNRTDQPLPGRVLAVGTYQAQRPSPAAVL
jgi:pilus assembly protein CpaB